MNEATTSNTPRAGTKLPESSKVAPVLEVQGGVFLVYGDQRTTLVLRRGEQLAEGAIQWVLEDGDPGPPGILADPTLPISTLSWGSRAVREQ